MLSLHIEFFLKLQPLWMTIKELLHDALTLTEQGFAKEHPKYIKKQKNKNASRLND